MPAKNTPFERGLLSEYDDGSKTLAIALDNNRCVCVLYMPPFPLGVEGWTVVSVESHDPDISLQVQKITGADTFYQGATFALSLILCLELLRDDEQQDLRDEFFPDTHVAKREIANARAGLMTVAAHQRAHRTG